jgi:hypothetical protein
MAARADSRIGAGLLVGQLLSRQPRPLQRLNRAGGHARSAEPLIHVEPGAELSPSHGDVDPLGATDTNKSVAGYLASGDPVANALAADANEPAKLSLRYEIRHCGIYATGASKSTQRG